MGASNFASSTSTSKMFVVLIPTEEKCLSCEDCSEDIFEYEEGYEELKKTKICECGGPLTDEEKEQHVSEWAYTDLIENIGESIKELGGVTENESLGNDHNYHKQTLGKLTKSKSYGDLELQVEVTAFIQSAYYQGATLDYEIKLGLYGDLHDYSTGSRYDSDINDVLDYVFNTDQSEMSAGLITMLKLKGQKWLEVTAEELGAQLEAVYEQHQQHKLVRVGGFSDGTSVYEEVA